ncbi:unnamed protein product [Pieris brassicae]|uniref:Uncharacterized protein n=1 Tax=Pieris brassicae TaxID=7116 RepID=A0A9P0TZD8_PIEBR|nr:unnamed protein product [Pieris brassicae]
MYKRNAGFEENVEEDEDYRYRHLSVLARRLQTVEFNDATNSTNNYEDDIAFTDDDWRNIDEIHKILDVIQTVVEALCRRDATLLTSDVFLKFALKKIDEMKTPLNEDLREIDIQLSTLTNEEELNRQLSQAVATDNSVPDTGSTCPSDDLLTTVRVEMALFENGGTRQRGRYLSLVKNYLHSKTIPPTSVEPEPIFSGLWLELSEIDCVRL